MKDNWKLLRFKTKGKPEVLELYNLRDDIGERNNLAAAHPETVSRLKALFKTAKTPAENKLFDWSEVDD
jgi:hypothetical protein